MSHQHQLTADIISAGRSAAEVAKAKGFDVQKVSVDALGKSFERYWDQKARFYCNVHSKEIAKVHYIRGFRGE